MAHLRTIVTSVSSEALSAVRQAVRAYMREPSPAHARQVEIAWRRVRQVDSVAR
jgi:hypothetical protein